MNALRLYQNAYKNQPFITHAIETGKWEGHSLVLEPKLIACHKVYLLNQLIALVTQLR